MLLNKQSQDLSDLIPQRLISHSSFLSFSKIFICLHQGFPVAQLVKNLPAMQETLVQFLGRKDLLEKG